MTGTMMNVERGMHRLCWYDIGSGALMHTLDLPEYPHEFVVDAENRLAYVGHYGAFDSKAPGTAGRSVFVVDMHCRVIVHTFRLGEHARPHGLNLDSAGRLYVLAEETATLLVKRSPGEFGDFDYQRPVGGDRPHLGAVLADGSRYFAMNLGSNDVTVFDPHDPEATPVSVRTGAMPEGRCFGPGEKVLYVTNRGDDTVRIVDTRTLDVVGSIQTPRDPMRVVFDERRGRIITVNNEGRSLSCFDAADGRELHRIETDDKPIVAAINAAQSHVFVPCRMDRILRISLDSFAVEHSYTVGTLPDVMHFLPAGFERHWAV